MSEITGSVELITDFVQIKDNLYSLKNDKNERIIKSSDEITNNIELNCDDFTFKFLDNEKWYKISFNPFLLKIPSNIFILTVNFKINGKDTVENIKVPVEFSNETLTLPGLKCAVILNKNGKIVWFSKQTFRDDIYFILLHVFIVILSIAFLFILLTK